MGIDTPVPPLNADTPLPALDTAGTINKRSEYARRYGVTNESFLGDQKSGISPIDDDPSKADDSEALQHLSDSIRYQEINLLGFRTKLLEHANALTGYDIRKSDLQAIHPMLQRDRWQTELPRHLAFYPVMAPGKSGFWVASNDDVWEVLKPVLALATKFIDHFHLWQWWDTLTFGRREVLQSESIPKVPPNKAPLVRVVPRSAAVAASQRHEGETARNEAAQKVIFGISSSWCNAFHGMPKPIMQSHVGASVRTWPGARGQIVVLLSFEELAPLMSPDMTDAERLMQQLIVAKTLVHELAHSLGYVLFTESKSREPYVADEPLIELGNSLINAILGGNNLAEITTNRKKWAHLREIHPLALLFRKGWPTFSNVWLRVTENRPCLDPKITAKGSEQQSFILPLNWVSDIQQEAYWDEQVAIYGASAVRPEPLTIGYIETLKSDGIEESRKTTRNTLMNKVWRGPYGRHDGPFTEEEKAARTQRIAIAQDTVRLLTGVIDESSSRKKVINKEGKDKKAAPPLKFRRPSESYKIAPGQGRPPGSFSEILALLKNNRQQLALDTMVNWIPANLFLSYILWIGQYQVAPTEFYEFLTSCQAFKAYFEYDKAGTGQVRKRDGPEWPPFKRTKAKVNPIGHQDAFTWALRRFRGEIHMSDGGDLLYDVDAEHMFEVMHRMSPKIIRPLFDRGMAHLDSIDGYYTYGPEGIYRLNPAIEPAEPPSKKKPAASPGKAAGPSKGPSAGPSTGPNLQGRLPFNEYQLYSLMRLTNGRKRACDENDSDSGSDSDRSDEEARAFLRSIDFTNTDEGKGKPRRKKQKR